MILARSGARVQFPPPANTEMILLVTGEFQVEMEGKAIINFTNPSDRLG